MDSILIKLNKNKKNIFILSFTLFISLLGAIIYTKLFGSHYGAPFSISVFMYRFLFLCMVSMFISLHLIVPINKIYNFLFRYRWIFGLFVLIVLVVFRFHGDSIAYFYTEVQPNKGDSFGTPLFGLIRAIRSDEYLVGTPNLLASQFGENPFGMYNNILRGTDTLNLVTGAYFGIPTLITAPWKLGFAFLPIEYAFSLYWYAPLILGFLMSFELFFILSRKKLVSLCATMLIIFSSWYLWWGFSVYFVYASGVIVCLYYFINTHSKIAKVLLSIGTAICFGGFIVNLYPAWQVPLGYIYLVIGICFLHENWDKIKNLNKLDWVFIILALIFCGCLVASYFICTKEYVNIINNTVYPGNRIDIGSYSLNKLFYFIQAPWYAYRDVGNPSEAGVFFSLFPIPTIVACYCWLKEKNKDWLTGGLLLIQIPMLLYITIGLPEIIAKVLLFTYSTSFRLVDMVGLIQIFLIVIIFSRYRNICKIHPIIAFICSIGTGFLAVYFSKMNFPNYLNIFMIIFMLFVIITVSFIIMHRTNQKYINLAMYVLIAVSLFTGIAVRPISVGLSSIYSKPVANSIKEINQSDKNAKWIATPGVTTQSFLVACGASTINSVNVYPNMDLWKKLDPLEKYDEVYNRYAHVSVDFTHEETSFEKLFEDSIRLNLSYKDIEKTKVRYLFVNGELSFDFNNGYVRADEIYNEDGVKIYRLIY